MQHKHALCLLGLTVVATTAIALGRPQFLRAPSASLGSPKVIVKWTEVGLGSVDTVSYVANATAAARYQCVNRGNNCPAASNKQDVLANVSVGGTFSVDKNGRISESLIIPAPPGSLVCPGNQVVGVESVVFTDIRLTDVTNGVSSPTNPSSLSYNARVCP
ncbi:hypothetical protein LF41_2648 [Lysobacter dokdonensis DS-58]|uniref:Uncharacterized protein n=1 Tax=Lysobacter dokdonensis DS-58 TaxID=1300345 RepID=A0A0A2WN66_9GAMM|nr:hypothetical protein [Lysobacter dokdonensis]KGQ19710.1 hypothetical protein LF41_2648 [Lysobacter dokdonensis DS-58]